MANPHALACDARAPSRPTVPPAQGIARARRGRLGCDVEDVKDVTLRYAPSRPTAPPALTIGSLFSGIGGLELGLEWAGLGPVVWQVERDPFARGVLAMHWPNANRSVQDVKKANASNLEPVDVICGGFPCQDISQAGKGAGLAGSRSGLWREFARIVSELRPRFVIVENVAALVARGLDVVAHDLERLRYRAEARIIAAADVGAPHRRDRLFIVAHRDVRRRQGKRARHDDDGTQPPGDHVGRRARTMGRPARQTKPGMGRDLDGVPDRVDRWPARPGEPVTIWEPRRATELYSPTHADRLTALGNAVVPQVARLVGLHVLELVRTSP